MTGNTALITAASLNDYDAVQLLLERGADPNALNAVHSSAALRICPGGGKHEAALRALKLLVRHGWNTNLRNNSAEDCLKLTRLTAEARERNGFGLRYSMVRYLEEVIVSSR